MKAWPALKQQAVRSTHRRTRKHGQRDVDLEKEGKRHAEQGGVRQRIAEIGEAAPDNEAAERTGDERNSNAGQNGAGEEVVKHCGFPSAPGFA
jgi:hypothetical protein